jgi:ferredoxin
VLQLPLVLKAGLGEMSRIGEVALNPFLGPRFKTSVITTDLPMAVDRPIDFGLQDFCEKCRKCAVECPCNAIPYGGKVMFNGYELWKPDVAKCTSYRVTNSKGGGCGRCLKMCPFNKEDLPLHRLALWLAIRVPALRALLARLDDLLGYGTRNPRKKWWWDLEIVDRRVTVPTEANQRDLKRNPKIPGDQKLAMFPADIMPAGDARTVEPVDRKEGLRRYEAGLRENADRKGRGGEGAA